jgi:sugar lactone lactonase YvrE
VHAEHGRRAISRTDGNGTHVLADAYEGMPLNSPNDLVIDRTGAVWFTDPLYGISDPREGYPAEPSLDHQSVYRWQEGRPLERMIDLDAPNGIGFSPDESTLYVAESHPDGLPRIARAPGTARRSAPRPRSRRWMPASRTGLPSTAAAGYGSAAKPALSSSTRQEPAWGSFRRPTW